MEHHQPGGDFAHERAMRLSVKKTSGRIINAGDIAFLLPLSLPVLSLKSTCDYGQGLMLLGQQETIGQDKHPHWPTKLKHTLEIKMRLQRGSGTTKHAGEVMTASIL